MTAKRIERMIEQIIIIKNGVESWYTDKILSSKYKSNVSPLYFDKLAATAIIVFLVLSYEYLSLEEYEVLPI